MCAWIHHEAKSYTKETVLDKNHAPLLACQGASGACTCARKVDGDAEQPVDPGDKGVGAVRDGRVREQRRIKAQDELQRHLWEQCKLTGRWPTGTAHGLQYVR